MNAVCFNAEKFYRFAFDYFNYESNIDLAKKCLKVALKNDKNHLKSLVLRGQIAYEENKLKGAKEWFFKALRVNGDEVNSLYFLSKIYFEENKQEKALEYLNKIFEQKYIESELLSNCYKLKIGILISINRYTQAEKLLKTLKYRLLSYDIYELEETFYKTVENISSYKKHNQDRILHINF